MKIDNYEIDEDLFWEYILSERKLREYYAAKPVDAEAIVTERAYQQMIYNKICEKAKIPRLEPTFVRAFAEEVEANL